MSSLWLCYAVIASISVVTVRSETRAAIAHLVSQEVTGSVRFTETEDGIHVAGTIKGLPAGLYGLHIHELGDTVTCDAAGSHYNPDGADHGGRDHAQRHVGDLGNVQFVGSDAAIAEIDFVDSVISLRGRNNVLGRTLMLHAQADDLGLGGHETSLTTGNAGGRVACAVIGVLSPSGGWED